jgi:membrane protease YdiL (CAAX protease family)
MSDVSFPDDQQPVELRPRPRGYPLLAWCLILAIVTLVIWAQQHRPAAGRVKETVNRLEQKSSESTARLLVGQKEMAPAPEEQYRQQLNNLDHGPYRQRLEVAVLAGELMGPQEALDRLAKLKDWSADEHAPSSEERRAAELLNRLYVAYARKNYTGDVLTARDKERLREDLGWFGELALAPAQGPDKEAREEVVAPARRFLIGIGVAVLAGLGLILLSLVVLVALLVLLFNGTLRRRFVSGSPYSGVYAETFALWMVVFVGLLVLGALLPESPFHLLQSSLLLLLSLGVLAWPVWRGVPWEQVRLDAGLYSGRGPVREVGSGIVCYVATLPLLIGGLVVVFVLMQLQRRLGGGGEMPTPPLVGVDMGNWWSRLQIVFAVSVMAPLIEETMFRGILYRHLREATGGLGFAGSFLLSGLVNSFLFAAVHPQGLISVPVLMALALGFTLAREWRGTLVPGMVMHGIHNGLITLFLFTAVS